MAGNEGTALAETSVEMIDARARPQDRLGANPSWQGAADAGHDHARHGHTPRKGPRLRQAPPRLPPSLLRLSLAQRALIAALSIAAIWVAVLAVMK